MLKTIGLWLLQSLLQFLGRELIDIINNARLQKLAVKVVENASKLDLDNDGKRKHAADVLKAEAKVLGYELRDRYVNLMIEAGLNKLKMK
jgi:ribose 1,5-bisphosphokinase PhnN